MEMTRGLQGSVQSSRADRACDGLAGRVGGLECVQMQSLHLFWGPGDPQERQGAMLWEALGPAG